MPARLEAVAAALGGRGCIVKDGYVVHQWGDQAEKSDWLSSAKPVLSTLLMFAIQEGKAEIGRYADRRIRLGAVAQGPHA